MIGYSNMLAMAALNDATGAVKTAEPDAEGYRSRFVFKVLLLGGYTFTFDVEDWDLGETPTSDEAVLSMAENMIQEDRPVLYGTLNGCYCATTIDPGRVVELALVL